jgi:hypothetical protein
MEKLVLVAMWLVCVSAWGVILRERWAERLWMRVENNPLLRSYAPDLIGVEWTQEALIGHAREVLSMLALVLTAVLAIILLWG